ncbi:MAG: polysaccharide deacetylase family protein [Acidimicrobiales bacterium]
MDRRSFLALAGLGAAGAGAVGGGVVSRSVGGEARPPGATADVNLEQPLEPRTGVHRVIWSVETGVSQAALTFDDGPDAAFTPRVLEILADHGLHATFMMMGFNVAQEADLARDVVAAGHEVGNHTWTHLNLLRETPQRQYEQIVRAHETISEVTGQECAYFRPPRGQLTGASLRHAAILGCDTLLWSVDRGAPGVSTPDAVADYAEVHLGPGDIIDLHDGIGRGAFDPDAEYAATARDRREVEIEALPRILQDAADRGLALGTVSELLATEIAPDRAGVDEGADEG